MKLLKISLCIAVAVLTVRPRSMNHMDADALPSYVSAYLFVGLVLHRAYRDGQERIHHSLFVYFFSSSSSTFVILDTKIIRCIFSVPVWHFKRVTDLSANRFPFICLFRLGFSDCTQNHETLTRWAPSSRAVRVVFTQPKDTVLFWRFLMTASNQRKCFGNAIPDFHLIEKFAIRNRLAYVWCACVWDSVDGREQNLVQCNELNVTVMRATTNVSIPSNFDRFY